MPRYPGICPDCLELYRGACRRTGCPKTAEMSKFARNRPSGRHTMLSLSTGPRAPSTDEVFAAGGGSRPQPPASTSAFVGTAPSVVAANFAEPEQPAPMARADLSPSGVTEARRQNFGTEPSVVAAQPAEESPSRPVEAIWSFQKPERAPRVSSIRRDDFGTAPSVVAAEFAGSAVPGLAESARQTATPPQAATPNSLRRDDFGTAPSVIAAQLPVSSRLGTDEEGPP